LSKRFTISLPDELVRRIEPFKDQLSLSAIMQKSLETELAELLRPNEVKAKTKALLKLAEEYYKEGYSTLVKTVSVFIDYTVDKAVLDSDKYLFRLYAWLQTTEIRTDMRTKEVPELDERLNDWVRDIEERLHLCQPQMEEQSADGGTNEETPHPSDLSEALSAIATFWHGGPEEISEMYPGEGTWTESDFLRVLKIVLHERLYTLLGEDAIRSFLTWQSCSGPSGGET
jgi:hypothetical protein